MLRVIEAGLAVLPPVSDVDVWVVLGDREHPQAAALIPPDCTHAVARYFLLVTSRKRRVLMTLDGEQAVIETAARLGALPDELVPPGEVLEVHCLLRAGLARRAQEAAQTAALAAVEAEGSA